MNKKCILLSISLCYFSLLWGQNKAELPGWVKVGAFYFYPKDSKDPFYILRNDSVQEEINLSTKDTLFWRIRWQGDSVLHLQYLSGTKKLSDDERSFYNAHAIVTRINSVTSNYYTFSGGLDSVTGLGNTKDTLWFKPRMMKNWTENYLTVLTEL